MRKILVFQHVAWQNLSTLEPHFRKGGFRVRYVNFDREPDHIPEIEKYNGLVMLGGPMGVYEKETYSHLKIEIHAIEKALKAEIPILGICLGAQLLAQVLGSHVRKHTEREMGWKQVQLTELGSSDPFLGHFDKNEYVFQSHGDTFDIPKTAEHLARSKMCEGQAFRYGQKVYGLQFHLEANQAYVDRWVSLPPNMKYMEGSGGVCTSETIESDTKKYLPRSIELSDRAFTNFLRNFGEFDRKVVVGSGHGKSSKG